MFRLKKISKDSVPQAIEKAERYRLLNEPGQAVSICQDVLEIEPQNQKAVITMILALTDRFSRGFSVSETGPEELLERLKGEYERAYYTGIILERRAKAILNQGGPMSNFQAYDLFHEAMECYENAEKLHAAGNDEATLRWNACVRIITQNNLHPKSKDDMEKIGDFLE
jgi:hypothetical protein